MLSPEQLAGEKEGDCEDYSNLYFHVAKKQGYAAGAIIAFWEQQHAVFELRTAEGEIFTFSNFKIYPNPAKEIFSGSYTVLKKFY